MAWTTPRTWVTGEVVRARYFNTDVRDNSRALVGEYDEILTSENVTTVTPWSDIATVGPTVHIEVTSALICFWGAILSSAASQYTGSAPAITGPPGGTSVAASDTYAVFFGQARTPTLIGCHIFTGLTAGVNTVQLKYRVSGGTGTAQGRWVLVYPQ